MNPKEFTTEKLQLTASMLQKDIKQGEEYIRLYQERLEQKKAQLLEMVQELGQRQIG